MTPTVETVPIGPVVGPTARRVAEGIERERIALGVTKVRLAELMDSERQYLARRLPDAQGDVETPFYPDEIAAAARALGITVASLFAMPGQPAFDEAEIARWVRAALQGAPPLPVELREQLAAVLEGRPPKAE